MIRSDRGAPSARELHAPLCLSRGADRGALEPAGDRASRPVGELETRARAIATLIDAEVSFLVAGAYAFFAYTGILRDTKDLDVILRERDIPLAFCALERAGFDTDLLDPRWIGKAYAGDSFVDLIFSSSNGLGVVDDLWFEHARSATILGHPCRIAPVEEIIFTKAFVDERERYDGADVNHLIYACGGEMDWERLLARFGQHWEVLFAHLILYRFVYPCARSRVPDWLMEELCRRTLSATRAGDLSARICRGNLISTRQYEHDYEKLGLEPPPRLEAAAARGKGRTGAGTGFGQNAGAGGTQGRGRRNGVGSPDGRCGEAHGLPRLRKPTR